MSSSYSSLHNYDQPIWSPNMELVQTALNMKQTKLDVNRQKLQNLADQFGSLDVLKQNDQEYVEERLQQVSQITNKYSSGDLSDDGLARSLQTNLSQVIDDNVKNAVLSTKLFRSEQSAWDELETKNPERYNETNKRFAMQNAQAWMQDENVGSVYRGGGGVINWDDYQGRLVKELPKIAEDMKATWVVQEGSPYGMFVDNVTKEAVPRDKVESAVKAIVGEKGMQQMQIDAWGKYDRMSDEDIRARFDSKYQAKAEATDSDVTGLENLIAVEKDPQKRERLLNQLEISKGSKQQISNSSYDNIVATSGRAAAYTSLFADETMGAWVDMYSYLPRDIKRDVDENNARTVEFNESKRRWELDYDMKEKNYLIALSKEKREADAAAAKAGKTAPGSTTGESYGDIEKITYEGTKGELEFVQAQYDDSMRGLREVLGGVTPSSDQFSQLTAEFGKNFEIGKTIKIAGKDVKITRENFTALDNFRINVLTESPEKKSLREGATKAMRDTQHQLRNIVQKGDGSWDASEMTRMGWKLVEENGRLVKKPTTKEDGHYAVRLLQKDPTKLSKAEKATLDAYTGVMFVGDKGLDMSESERRLFLETTRKNLISQGLSSKDFTSIAPSVGKVMDMTPVSSNLAYSKVDTKYGGSSGGQYGREFSTGFIDELRELGISVPKTDFQSNTVFLTAKNAEDIDKLANLKRNYSKAQSPEQREELAKKIRAQKEVIKSRANYTQSGGNAQLSEIQYWDADYTENGQAKKAAVPSQVLKSALESFDTEYQQIKKQRNLMTYQAPIYDVTSPKYQTLRNILVQDGKITSDFKGSIEVIPDFDNNQQMTDAVGLKINVKDSKGVVRPIFTTTKRSILEKNGVSLAEPKRTPYDASFGSNAPSIDLGAGKAMELKSRDPIIANSSAYLENASLYGEVPVVHNILQNYYNGAYTFSLKAYDGEYYSEMSGGGLQQPWIQPTGVKKYSQEDVIYLKENQGNIVSSTIDSYLKATLEDIQIKNADKNFIQP